MDGVTVVAIIAATVAIVYVVVLFVVALRSDE